MHSYTPAVSTSTYDIVSWCTSECSEASGKTILHNNIIIILIIINLHSKYAHSCYTNTNKNERTCYALPKQELQYLSILIMIVIKLSMIKLN